MCVCVYPLYTAERHVSFIVDRSEIGTMVAALNRLSSLSLSLSLDPYVRVLMLNSKTGKKMKKKKTTFLRAVAQPEFNETLTFDLTVAQLDTVQFLVVLCSKVSQRSRVNRLPPRNDGHDVMITGTITIAGPVGGGIGRRRSRERQRGFRQLAQQVHRSLYR